MDSRDNPYPHPVLWKRILDKLVIALGITSFFATIPQAWEIWINGNASGVSLISWSFYTFQAFVLLTYGLVHKEKPIIFTYVGNAFLFALIAIGAAIY